MAWGRKKREQRESAALMDANRAPDGSVTLLLPGGGMLEVVGESHYQPALDKICGGEDGRRDRQGGLGLTCSRNRTTPMTVRPWP